MKSTMLIVEDDRGLLPSLERSFTRRGYEVIGASTVSQASDVLRQRGVDLVLLDIQLPDGRANSATATCNA